MGPLSSLKIPSNVRAAKKLFETCCTAYADLMSSGKSKLHWTRLEYSIRCAYPNFEALTSPEGISLQEMSTATNQSIYGITVPVEHYLKSLDLIIGKCLQQGLNSGHNSDVLNRTSSKVKYVSMLVRQLGVTGMLDGNVIFFS